METGIIISFILFIICFTATLFTRIDGDFFICCFGGTCAFFISLLVITITYDLTPTAMDVYKGKTTIEYTVVDGVKVDSTVVWKKEK